MIIIETTTKREYSITDSLRNGENDIICPACVGDRKSKNKKPLHFNAAKGTGKCYHCDAVFVKKDPNQSYMPEMTRVFQKPVWKNKTDLSDNLIKYFEGRRISQNTLVEMKISEGIEWMSADHPAVNTVQFNYFRDGELINVKYRTGDKQFRLHKDAELILYNLDAIKESDECLICEGEIDCLSWIESGYPFSVSVPNGAAQKTQNLQYIDNCFDYFENKTKIYISNDNDSPGVALRDELIRRLGSERCFLVDLEGKKDANDYLCAYGGQMLLERLKSAKDIPIEGVFSVKDYEVDLDVLFENGLSSGLKLNLPKFDDLITWETGRLLIITGIPGHGKSEFADELIVRLNILHGWRAAYFSPENSPLTYHFKKIIERVSGKWMKKSNMSNDEYLMGKDYMNQNYKFILPPDDEFTLDNILDKARQLVYKHGIRVLVVDPWNRLEYQQDRGETETKYIARQLIKMTNFAKRNDVLFILAAHPVKMMKTVEGKYEIPNLYSISGSANFFNIADYGLSIYKDDNKVSVYVQKVKFKHLGTTGVVDFKYNKDNGRYSEMEDVGETLVDNRNWIVSGLTETISANDNEFWSELQQNYDKKTSRQAPYRNSYEPIKGQEDDPF